MRHQLNWRRLNQCNSNIEKFKCLFYLRADEKKTGIQATQILLHILVCQVHASLLKYVTPNMVAGFLRKIGQDRFRTYVTISQSNNSPSWSCLWAREVSQRNLSVSQAGLCNVGKECR